MALILTPEQLAGVHAKLERADENIRNLDAEITAFLKERPAGGFTEDKEQRFREFAKFHAERPVPPRFGVLAGEIAHHLRTSLDHVVWLLSSDSYRRAAEKEIGFPVLTVPPTTTSKIAGYDRKIAGISSAEAKTIIDSVQPYKAGNPLDEPLAIVHDLDRIDKHQAIVLVVTSWDAIVTLPLPRSINICGADMSEKDMARRPTEKLKMEFSPQIAFARLGQGVGQTVIPSLAKLVNAVRDVVKLFGS